MVACKVTNREMNGKFNSQWLFIALKGKIQSSMSDQKLNPQRFYQDHPTPFKTKCSECWSI